MTELGSQLWGWWLGAGLIGFAMGWVAVAHHGEGLSRRAMGWIAAVVVVLAGLAAGRLVPGRPGYWLDLALVMLALYGLGCLAGSALRHAVVSRQARPE